MTPKEAARCANRGLDPQGVQKFLVSASARDLQEFSHSIGDHTRDFTLARIALDVRLAEDADDLAKRFQEQMDSLIGIAEAQRKLAHRLDRFTIWLIVFTVVLCILTVILIWKG